jgi:Spy/CpxP family protein refolding chaperone
VKATKETTMRALSLLLAMLLCLAGALPALGGEHGHGRKHKRPPLDEILERHADRLGLDAESLARIRTVADASRPEHERLADELHALRLELRELLGQDEPDRDAVMRQADRVGAAETALDKHRLATLLEIRALLTPAQRQELVRIHEERRRQRKQKKAGPAEPAAP